jgi:hypothetical protein
VTFRRVTRDPSHDREIVGAIVQPKPNVSDADVVAYLESRGASGIANLAPGFLSVSASRAALREAESIATVEVKGTKAMHR